MSRNRTSRGRNPRFTKSIKSKHKHRKTKKKLVIVSTKQVKKWNKAAVDAKIDVSLMRNHVRSVQQSSSARNASSFSQESTPFSVTKLRDACDARKIQNVAATAVNLTQNVIAQTALNKLDVRVSAQAHYFNNFAIPFWVDVYCWVPRVDSGGGPVTNFVAGMVDVGLVDAASPSITSVFVYPSMSGDLMKFWKIASHKKVCLGPGESVSLGFQKKFKWSPSFTQAHTDTFQEAYGSHVFTVRLQGCFGHAVDVTSELGVGATSLDWYVDRLVEVKYDANGAKYRTEEFDTAQMTAASAIVVGWKSNAENTTGTQAPG